MNDVSPGKLVQIIAAGVTLIFSFLPWQSYSAFGDSVSRSAWGSGMFPIATWAPVFALAAGFLVAAEAFQFLKLPEKIWEFTVDQIVLVLSAFALLITLSYLIIDKGPASIGFGLIVCFLGTIAMVAGFFMDKAGVGVNPNAGAAQQQPGFPPPGQPGYPPVPGQAAPPVPGQAAPPAPGQAAPPAQQQPPQQQPGSF